MSESSGDPLWSGRPAQQMLQGASGLFSIQYTSSLFAQKEISFEPGCSTGVVEDVRYLPRSVGRPCSHVGVRRALLPDI